MLSKIYNIMTREIDIPKLVIRYTKQKEYMREYAKSTGYKQQREYLATNPEMRLFHATKQRAKKAGIEFSLTLSDIKIPEVCPYLGLPITNIYGCGRIRTNASLDRIDPSKGYVPENIQIISDLANRMKQNATSDELLLFADGVKRIHGT